MLRVRVRTAAVLTLAASLFLFPAACKKPKGDKEGGGDGSSASGSPTPGRPLTADDLQPVIREIGASGVVPKAVVFEFSSRVVESSDEGSKAGEKTVIKVTPDAPGYLEWTGPSTLTFTPRSGFQYATKYSVVLEAVETRTGVIAAPSAGAWSRSFSTPEFVFVPSAWKVT
jgi:alpha-2-macroglobulin